MKKKLGIIIAIVIIIIGIIMTFATININKSSNSSKPNSNTKKTSIFKKSLEKLKKGNYAAELVYYVESPEIENIHHKFVEFEDDGKIEVFYSGIDNDKQIAYYNDYQNKRKIKNYIMVYKSSKLNTISHKDMLITLLTEAKVKNEGSRYFCTLDKDKVRTYLEELNKHDSNSLKYQDGVTYEADISIKDSTILSIIIREEDSDKDVVYKFSKFGEIETIQLPENVQEEK